MQVMPRSPSFGNNFKRPGDFENYPFVAARPLALWLDAGLFAEKSMFAMSSERVWNGGMHTRMSPTVKELGLLLGDDFACPLCRSSTFALPSSGEEDNVPLEVAINGTVSSQRKMIVTRL